VVVGKILPESPATVEESADWMVIQDCRREIRREIEEGVYNLEG